MTHPVRGTRGVSGRQPLCLACLAALLACAICAAGLTASSARADESPATAEAMSHATALSRAFRHAAEEVSPAVVVVRSEVKARRPGRGQRDGRENPFKGTPFEDMFPNGVPEGFEFNMPEGGGPPRSGVGSGVIVDPSGIVITNNHVVEDADVVTVELSDGREFRAVDIKTDPETDLAVIRLGDAQDLPSARLGDSDKLAIGDWVIAIGNPFELETTVSAGIISGKGRELGSVRRAQFLQTDAAINPGNSGGPLVSLDGEVIGINTAIASNNGSYQGVGFAIPSTLAKWVTGQLIAKGKVERAFIGVQMGPLDAKMAVKLGAANRKGVLVNDVVPDSPAAEAGVQELDVITAFDDKTVEGSRSLQEIVERSDVDKPHTLTVLRDGKSLTLTIGVKPLPSGLAARGPQPQQPAEAPSEETYYAKDFGLEVAEKADRNAEAYEGFDGVVVERVDPDGVAAAAGLGPGVLIRAVGKATVANLAEFSAAIEKESADAGVLLKVRTPRGNAVILLQRQ